MHNHKIPFATLLLTSCFAIISFVSPAKADPLPFFETIPNGRTEFDTRVNDAGGTLFTDALSGLAGGTNTWVEPDFTITSTNGANRNVNAAVLNPAPTGLPGGDAISMNADGSVTSGLTFTFNNAINGFGIELDDWATCCFPSSLYLSFDGGAPILVGTASVGADNPGIAAGHGAKTFIGAIDDSGTFTVVTFYGTGAGDALNAGGIIRYALVPLGSISGNYVATAAPTSVSNLANYLDQNDDSGTLQTVATYLNTASQEEVEQSLKEIFPVNSSVTSQTMMNASGQTANVLIDKVGTVLGEVNTLSALNFRNGAAGSSSARFMFEDTGSSRASPAGEVDVVAALASSPYKKFIHGENAVWVEGVGAGIDGDSTASTFGYDAYSRGFVAGYERALSEDYLVGVLGSSFFTDIDLDQEAGDTEARNYNFGIYGQRLFGATKVTGVITGGYGNYDTERRITVGAVTSTPESDYDSWSYSAAIGASHLFEHGPMRIEPFTMISYTAVHTEGYTEEDGGAFNQSVSADNFSTASAKIGVTVQHDTELQGKNLSLKIKPYAGRQWEIEDPSTTTRFLTASSSTTINGRDLSLYEVGVGGEAKLQLSPKTSLKLGVDASHDKYEDRYIGFVGFGWKF